MFSAPPIFSRGLFSRWGGWIVLIAVLSPIGGDRVFCADVAGLAPDSVTVLGLRDDTDGDGMIDAIDPAPMDATNYSYFNGYCWISGSSGRTKSARQSGK